MFLKRTRSKNFTYLSIVETYREDEAVKHRTLLQLGREDELRDNKVLQGLVDSISRVSGVTGADGGGDGGKVALESLKEEARFNWGAVKVYRALWDLFELDKILLKACRSRRRRFDLSATVFAAVVARLLRPSSKLKIYERQHQYIGLNEVSLEHLYRAMTELGKGKDVIERELFDKQRNLFNMKVDVVLYDVTTLYFESVRNDSLKDFGYSKDTKFNEVQVVLGLLVDMEGRPVGFDFFPGNTFEGHTLIKTLIKLRDRFQIRQIIIVADRGINNKLNLAAIKAAGFEYIVGSRLKNLPLSAQHQILDRTQYTPLLKNEDGEIELAYQAFDYQNKVKAKDAKGATQKLVLNELLVCTWSKKRAAKDQKDRLRLIEKAEALLRTPSKLSTKRGPRRFIKSSASEPHLDLEQIKKDAAWDGYYAIQSSEKNSSANYIIDAYHSLWKIEESFRVMKHTLQARPIFHWRPHRVKGHLVLCFITFLLERTLELTVQQRCADASPDKIREALASLEVSLLTTGQHKVYLPAKISAMANHILRSLQLPVPKHVSENPP